MFKPFATPGSTFVLLGALSRRLGLHSVALSLRNSEGFPGAQPFGLQEQLVTRTLLGAKGIATRNKDATRGSWPYYKEQVATSNKKLLGVPGIATRSKDATSSSWPY